MIKSRDDSWIMNKKSVQQQSCYTDIETKNVGLKTISYSFAKEPKKTKIKSMKPGPGSYFMEKTEVNNRSLHTVSFAKSERSTLISEMPPSSSVGPGNYQLDQSFSKILPKSISVSVIKSKRFTNVTEKTPGPGQYEIDVTKVKHQDPKWSLSKQVREVYTVKKEVPGPGVYNITSTIGTGQKVNISIDRYRLL
jgi:hypothetical protein